MIDTNALSAILSQLPTVRFTGTLYRAIDYEALHGFQSPAPYQPNPFYCHGAPTKGARYTPKGGMPSLYLAEHYTTAYEEANQVYLNVQAINPRAVPGSPPTVILSARAEITTVFDLANPLIQQALATNLAELTAPWRLFQRAGGVAPTQILSQAVFDGQYAQAIRYPSAVVPNRCCFVLFCGLISPPSLIEVYDPNGNLVCKLP
jgi:RES domain-containing protein